jgi:hypothetical protein
MCVGFLISDFGPTDHYRKFAGIGPHSANTTYRYVNANVETAKRAVAMEGVQYWQCKRSRLRQNWCTDKEAVLNSDWSTTVQPNKAYDKGIEFIASSTPQKLIAFRPSEEAKARVADLIVSEKTEGLQAHAHLYLTSKEFSGREKIR